MRWIVCLALAACGGNKVKPTETPLPPEKPAVAPDAAPVAAPAPTPADAVKALTALADEICACKDEACVQAVVEKSSTLNEKFAGLTITPELEKELEGVQRRAFKCMRSLARGGDPPSDPRLRAPTKDDLAAYLKDIPGKGPKLVATITTSLGAFTCELFPDKAPITVANFVGLATGKKPWHDPKAKTVVENKPFFNGLLFHRVIPGFMIQGGDPMGTGVGGPGYEFDDEVETGLLVEAGSLAMANSGPATNGSQFFVMEARAQWLDNKHTVFGKCAELDLVKKITGVEKECPSCDANDPAAARPKTPVTIKSIAFARK